MGQRVDGSTVLSKRLHQKARFTHLTGLKWKHSLSCESGKIGEHVRSIHLGTWRYVQGNTGVVYLVAVTCTGEVWMAVGDQFGRRHRFLYDTSLVQCAGCAVQFFPVMYTNAAWRIRRLKKPYEDFGGVCPPTVFVPKDIWR